MLVEDLVRKASLGKQADLILLDFWEALDKVNLQETKTGQYGFTLKVWIRAFLGKGCWWCLMSLRNQTRSQSPLERQGSVLGPILFLIYTYELPENIISQVKVCLFADDTAVSMIRQYIWPLRAQTTALHYKNDLDRLSVCESHWDSSKCQVVQVKGSRKPFVSEYKLHGQMLETVTSAKYLVVDLSSNMSWGPHIGRITENANKTLSFIKRNIKTKMLRVRQMAYNGWYGHYATMWPQFGTPVQMIK